MRKKTLGFTRNGDMSALMDCSIRKRKNVSGRFEKHYGGAARSGRRLAVGGLTGDPGSRA
jgi:hypothetical protein